MIEVDSFLSHYGVKGMKWGVRNEHVREYKEVATKDTANNIAKRQMANVNMVRYMAKGRGIQERQKFNETWYNSLSTGKEYINKGHDLSRVVRGVDKNALSGGYMYVSQLKSDHDMYTATIPAFTNGFKAGKKQYHSAYQVSLETKRKLSMPSPKERVDTFIETLQTKDGKKWLAENGYKGEIDEMNAKQVGLKYYQKFNKYAGNKDVKLNNVYFDTIKAKGYDALIDDNDAGIWSKKPTILLNPKGTVKITNVRQLSEEEINEAHRKVMKLRDYKTDKQMGIR
jgi:hypothetical protein